jgi:LicD family
MVHWLDYGSLLGAVRCNALIPWDEDVDFGCLGDDFGVLKSLGPETEEEGFHLDLSDPKLVRIAYSLTNLQHVDVFPWFERDGILTTGSHDGFYLPGMFDRDAFPVRYIENLETVRLSDEEFPAPSPVRPFLIQHRYGEDYMAPQRWPSITNILVPSLFKAHGPETTLDDATPTVRELIEELANLEQQFLALKAKPTRTYDSLTQRWFDAGLRPSTPDPERVRVRRASLPAGEASPVVEALLGSIAVLEQAIRELEHPSMRVAVRRAQRRTRRLLGKVVRRQSPSEGAP